LMQTAGFKLARRPKKWRISRVPLANGIPIL
jgi:hypothetical protein